MKVQLAPQGSRPAIAATVRTLLASALILLGACAPASHDATDAAPSGPDEVITQEGEEAVPLTAEEEAELAEFTNPDELDEKSDPLADIQGLDPKGVVPKALLKKAVAYFEANKSRLKNQNYLTVVDFSKPSSQRRLFIVNMKSGSVLALHVAHGEGSDRDDDAYAERFSNVEGSNASSLGFYKTAETYQGKNGYSLRLDGLSSSNSNARMRAVVVHGSDYVKDKDKKQGRSWGCPAVSHEYRDKVINMIKNGSLIYASN